MDFVDEKGCARIVANEVFRIFCCRTQICRVVKRTKCYSVGRQKTSKRSLAALPRASNGYDTPCSECASNGGFHPSSIKFHFRDPFMRSRKVYHKTRENAIR